MARITKRFKKILTATVLLGFLGMAAYTLGWSNTFVVKEITYSGVGAGSPEGMLIKNSLETPQTGLITGRPLARLNTAALSSKLARIDWISTQSISRNWLNGRITIKVSLRKPVAQFQDQTGKTKYLDQTGAEFGLPSAPEISATNIPVITLSGGNSSSRVAAAKFISQMPAAILESMTSLVISDSQSISMNSQIRKSGLAINWGTPIDLQSKVAILNRLLALPENKKATQVDLSSLNSPVVK